MASIISILKFLKYALYFYIVLKSILIVILGFGGETNVDRKAYPVVPSKVEYSQIEQGKSLMRILDSVYQWGKNAVNKSIC
ncbi:winged helix-turn-helix transcriptional regulator [Bacillota bacterium Lsc_1132]